MHSHYSVAIFRTSEGCELYPTSLKGPSEALEQESGLREQVGKVNLGRELTMMWRKKEQETGSRWGGSAVVQAWTSQGID